MDGRLEKQLSITYTASGSEEAFPNEPKMLPDQGSSKRTRRRRSNIKPRGKTWVIERNWRTGGCLGPVLRKGKKRDWAAIPRDALSAIFEKVGPINVLLTAQFVCRSWQQAAHDPRSWRCADFTLAYWDVFDYDDSGFEELVKAAVDRSGGAIEEFGLRGAGKDDTLLYMAQRSSKLKRLRLFCCSQIHDDAIIETFKLCPLMEDVEISTDSFGNGLFDDAQSPHWPPLLKRFFLHGPTAPSCDGHISNDVALCIAANMPQLRQLELIGNFMNNEGLRAILEGCPLLETLELFLCFNLDFQDEDIKRRYLRLKKSWGGLLP